MNPATVFRVFLDPAGLFRDLAAREPSVKAVFVGYALWLGLLPPACAYVGVVSFGWRFGVGEPVQVGAGTALLIALAYYLSLLLGFGVATFLTRWMAPTYGASENPGLHAALVAVVGTPLMAGGLLHLYPLLPLNLLFLVPAILWSAYLLYTGIPRLLGIDVDRGMLMATSVLGVFFVAAVALAAFTMILWTLGVGPDIGFHWRSTVGG